MRAKKIIDSLLAEAKLNPADASLLAELDSLIGAPPNPLNDWVWDALFNAYGEDIAGGHEPEDEEEAAAFQDSTLKHQVFDYGTPGRREFAKAGRNDLAYSLVVDFVMGEEELRDAVLQTAREAHARSQSK